MMKCNDGKNSSFFKNPTGDQFTKLNNDIKLKEITIKIVEKSDVNINVLLNINSPPR